VSNRIFFWEGIFRGVYFSDFGIQLAGMKMNQKKKKSGKANWQSAAAAKSFEKRVEIC